MVTGGSGFIGSHVVDVLIEQGHTVTNLDIKAPHREGLTYINGSILDRELVNSVVGNNDVIFHIGGFSNINFVKNNPVETIEQNILSTTYLLDACKEKIPHPHIIYASSVYVFDRMGHLYTTSKASSERIIEDFNVLYSIPYTILRYATVYGPRNRGADVVFLFLKGAIKNNTIEIQGDGRQTRNFTHVRDIAEGSVRVIGNKKAIDKTLSIASTTRTSINELADLCKETVDSNVKIIHNGIKREKDYFGEIKNIEETLKILDWEPSIKLIDGIKELQSLIKK